MSHLSVSEVARRLGANPQDISALFYKRKLRDDLCPIAALRKAKTPLPKLAEHLNRTILGEGSDFVYRTDAPPKWEF